MSDKAWKAFERWGCKQLGGRRRGVYGRGNDCVLEDRKNEPWYSAEMKYRDKIHLSDILAAIRQAEGDKEHPDDIAFAWMKEKGWNNEDSIVCFSWKEFSQRVLPILQAYLKEQKNVD